MASAFITAAGNGTRLAPWTSVVPAPALPLANEPAMGFLLRLAARSGTRHVVASASWPGDVLVGTFGDGSAHGVELSWSVEEAPLGTAGGVLAAEERLRDGGEPIMVLSGDGLHDVDLASVERAHRESGAIATLALLPDHGHPEHGVADAGIYVLQPEVLDHCRAWGLTDVGTELFPRMVEEGMHVHRHALDGAFWNGMRDLDEWRAANVALLDGRVDAGPGSWNDDGVVDRVLVHPTARIGDGVQLVGPCVVGEGATIGDGAILRSALVLPYARVPASLAVASGTVGSVAGLERWVHGLRG